MPARKSKDYRRWTPAEDRTLRLLWGERSVETVRRFLRRTRTAILERARKLKLPPQRQGKQTMRESARTIGIAPGTLKKIMRDCGYVPIKAVPISAKRSNGASWLDVDVEAASALIVTRDNRTCVLGIYCQRHALRPDGFLAKLKREGIYYYRMKKSQRHYPLGLLDEVRNDAPGTWTAAWKAVMDAQPTSPAIEPWFVCLALHDRLHGTEAEKAWLDDALHKRLYDIIVRLEIPFRRPGTARSEPAVNDAEWEGVS